jgi:hypothetical protein
MNRKPHTLESVRDAIEIRAMLAYPYGTKAWFTNLNVMEEIGEAYPEAWRECLSCLNVDPGETGSTLRTRYPRIPVRLFNVMLKLGRRETTEVQAIMELRRCCEQNKLFKR